MPEHGGEGERPSLVYTSGPPEETFPEAAKLSEKLHIIYKKKPFRRVLSCAPPMYDEMWTAGKCAYKLDSVVEDGGELIIYAPGVNHLSITYGKAIEEIGYHCRDYFLGQWDRFGDIQGGIIAHFMQRTGSRYLSGRRGEPSYQSSIRHSHERGIL